MTTSKGENMKTLSGIKSMLTDATFWIYITCAALVTALMVVVHG